ncbi:TetR/AcrR family transcriptional regulator [Winogradskyella litoriviva]|uniref:TetR/AcrR family transcriptional regulator n=1 Tax=Winogradskyella litoriviva TaxID=1220182 RepID=A0ABX2E7H4_9FLAO|nr:TetR/AcrR family transcriptional regulator [Winogradskyella litoriviva]NRD24365.1 TetR/AcrR family transcriptional regulator [Winogradskyella litoriviva]|tara:strand:- start:104 stop:706 length:603 start_codon:yes stop_codon:yes gene_type:complete
MKEKIIFKSTDLFLNLGFKSVTMDDIANEMGISKKTIYQHFQNKTKLVEATALHVFENISCGIDNICALNKNPIEEVYEIKRFVMHNLKDEKSSPQYQLQKYYPKIYASVKGKQFQKMLGCVTQNLERGVTQGLYRDSIEIDFVARLYFNGMVSLKDQNIFPRENFSMVMLMNNYLEYHLRGICSTKGLEKLTQLNTNQK